MVTKLSMHMFIRCTLSICFAFIVLSSPSFAQKDKIFPLKGASVTGKIVDKTRDKVVMEVRNSSQNFPTNEIGRIVYDGEPQNLSRAKDWVSQGQFEQAYDEWKKVDAANLSTDEMKQDHLFYKGYILGSLALKGKGDPKAAIGALNSWSNENKNSPYFFWATEQLGHLAMAVGRADAALKYYGALGESLYPDVKLKGAYYLGKAQLVQKQNKEAKAKFESVIEAKLSDPVSLRLQKLARVAIVKCDVAEGKVDESISTLEKMVDDNDSTDGELFAEIFNTMGGIFQSGGRDEEALLSYLKTHLLYPSQPEAHAEALFNLVGLWSKIGENTRSTEYKSLLTKTYPTSTWATKK